MDNQLAEIDKSLQELTAQIPSYLSQEEVILLVDELSKKDKLSVQLISFDNAAAMPSPVSNATVSTPVWKNDEASGAATETTSATEQSTAAEQTGTASSAAPTMISQDITLSFTGSYAQIYSFLSDVEQNLRKVAVKGISLQRSKGDILTGQMKLSFISYWDAEGQLPYTMDVAPIPGKDSPFVPYLGYSESATKGTAALEAPIQPDFYMLVNGYLDNAAKVILSQYPKTESEASADVNGQINANIVLNGSNGEFTYSYTVGASSKAGQTAIKARDGKIWMEVLVQARKSDQDKVAVTLDVTNNSGMPLEITVKGDNTENPRFKLGKTTGSVNVK